MLLIAKATLRADKYTPNSKGYSGSKNILLIAKATLRDPSYCKECWLGFVLLIAKATLGAKIFS